MFGGEPPESMTKEWQEQTNELLKVCALYATIRDNPYPHWNLGMLTHMSYQEQRADPLTGISSDVYKGPGMVQSPPKGA